MVGAVFFELFLFLISQAIFNSFARKHAFFSKKLMNMLFLYHLFFAGVYYTYALFNPSDSKKYFDRPQWLENWGDYFGTSTTFIDFLSWPFINILNFNYEMMMLLYAWMGFMGFVYAYLFFRENIPIKIEVFKLDFLVLLLFLPNMHFWTASLGKGAPIFLGLMLYAYAIFNPKARWLSFILGSILIYFIRPHVFLFVAVGTVFGYMTGKEKISIARKVTITAIMVTGLFLAKDSILAMAGMDNTENVLDEFEEFSETRAIELSKTTSGVDMASYPLPLKLFTFWFRPLFFDAPGFLGIIVSVENLVYLLLFLKIIKKDFIGFVRRSPVSVKMSLTVFLLSSLAMTFVMSNLGIIMRQKSMVMYFLFYVIFYYLAQKKYTRIMRWKRLKKVKDAREHESV